MRIQAASPDLGRRRFDPMRDLPVLAWLLAVVVVAVTRVELDVARWLMFHLLLLGAATHSILVWSQHFADALLHNAPTRAARRNRSARLWLLNAGVVVVVTGVVSAHWRVTAVGATAVAVAVAWHGASLVAQLSYALGSRFAVTVRYYVAAACLLPFGALFGVLMARGLGLDWHARVMIAHITVNVLGWVGLSVLGTLVTLWPTMLRTRIAEGAERDARHVLWVLLAGLVVAASGCLVGLRPVAGLGLIGYAAGMAVLARPFGIALLRKAPAHFATWSVLAGVVWFAGLVLVMGVGIAVEPTWMGAHEFVEDLTPWLAAGFGAQVLLGALSYLIPVSIGGGPAGVRAANIEVDRGSTLRVGAVNAGLLVLLLPVSPAMRWTVGAVVMAGFAAFVVLILRGVRAGRLSRQAPTSASAGRRGPMAVAADRPTGQLTGLAATGVGLVVLAVALGAAVDPSMSAGSVRERGSVAAGVTPTGATTRVWVDAANMRFTPATIEVPAGNRLVIDLRNTDAQQVHDLVLDSGARSRHLSPGQSAVVPVGIIGRNVEGWCSLPGHRQMGMVLQVRVAGLRATSQPSHPVQPNSTAMPGMPGMGPTSGAGDQGSAARFDPGASPGPGFRARDPRLPPAPKARVIRRTFTVSAVQREVAPGVRQRLWTYNGEAPGPVLHGKVGDRFVVRLVNDTDMGHSIDFHAGQVSPDRPMRTLAPGQALTYRFTAQHSGIWLYHCSTMPMSAHIANGMFGAVVIDPPHLPRVERSFVLVQSELYLGKQGGSVDVAKVNAERPDAVVFNGYANQYDADPLRTRVGERIRIWVLDAGPNRPTSFHVVGGQFDTVFSEGAYSLRRGNPERGAAQALSLGTAQGGFVELTFAEPGRYPFVSHLMIDAERGAHGVIDVSR